MELKHFCLEGTSNKIFGERCDYYLCFHAITILFEDMLSLRWEAFEEWCLNEHKDITSMSKLKFFVFLKWLF